MSPAQAVLESEQHIAQSELESKNTRSYSSTQLKGTTDNILPFFRPIQATSVALTTPSRYPVPDEFQSQDATASYLTFHTCSPREPSRLKQLEETLRSLMPVNGQTEADEFERPNEAAVSHAMSLLPTLHAAAMLPSRVSATGEGGIAFAYRNGKLYADIEFMNDGEVLALTSDGEGHVSPLEVDLLSFKNTIDAIRGHICR